MSLLVIGVVWGSACGYREKAMRRCPFNMHAVLLQADLPDTRACMGQRLPVDACSCTQSGAEFA